MLFSLSTVVLSSRGESEGVYASVLPRAWVSLETIEIELDGEQEGQNGIESMALVRSYEDDAPASSRKSVERQARNWSDMDELVRCPGHG